MWKLGSEVPPSPSSNNRRNNKNPWGDGMTFSMIKDFLSEVTERGSRLVRNNC
jgi:hypothetical protein